MVVQQTRDIAGRGNPHIYTIFGITRTTTRATDSLFLISTSCCSIHAPGHPGMAIRLLSLRLRMFPTLHVFAQEKAGGWGGGGRERLGTEYCTGLSKRVGEEQDRFYSALSAIPKHLSAQPRGDVVGVKSTLPVPQKKARHREELLLSWLMVSCLCCFWDSGPTRCFRHRTGHFTTVSASFIALGSSSFLWKSWRGQTLAA